MLHSFHLTQLCGGTLRLGPSTASATPALHDGMDKTPLPPTPVRVHLQLRLLLAAWGCLLLIALLQDSSAVTSVVTGGVTCEVISEPTRAGTFGMAPRCLVSQKPLRQVTHESVSS